VLLFLLQRARQRTPSLFGKKYIVLMALGSYVSPRLGCREGVFWVS